MINCYFFFTSEYKTHALQLIGDSNLPQGVNYIFNSVCRLAKLKRKYCGICKNISEVCVHRKSHCHSNSVEYCMLILFCAGFWWGRCRCGRWIDLIAVKEPVYIRVYAGSTCRWFVYLSYYSISSVDWSSALCSEQHKHVWVKMQRKSCCQ